jgi:uncharacterized membrane protein
MWEEKMNQEKNYIIALIALGVLASIPQIPFDYWNLILVIVGVVAGVMVKYEDVGQRTLIYLVAVAAPMFSNSLDVVPVIGVWVNGLIDNIAIGIQGMAVALFLTGLIARAKG